MCGVFVADVLEGLEQVRRRDASDHLPPTATPPADPGLHIPSDIRVDEPLQLDDHRHRKRLVTLRRAEL
jgi:hypothetical protein